MSSSFGGIGSTASSGDQETDASNVLQTFNRPISVAVIDQAQDWQTRQQIQYAALLGLLQQDFLSLEDWSDQISAYSRANLQQLSKPLAAIQNRLTLNSRLQAELVDVDGLGKVGEFLTQFDDFAKDFTLSADVTKNSDDLSTQLGVSD